MDAPATIPAEMRESPRWLLWRRIERGGKETKMPVQVGGAAASSQDPSHWTTYEQAAAALSADPSLAGLGFALGDGWAGVDLDDVLDAEGRPTAEAGSLLESLGSYAEVSPSGVGVKVFCRGALPGGGKKRPLNDRGAIELYDRGRFFTVTGQRLGSCDKIACPQEAIDSIWRTYVGDTAGVTPAPGDEFSAAPIAASALTGQDYAECLGRLLQLRPSISGEDGSGAMLHACCELRRWGVSDYAVARPLLELYNQLHCSPRWSAREIKHKWESAADKVPESAEEFAARLADRDRFDLGLLRHRDFMAIEVDHRFLVQGVVVQGQHMLLGGPKKSLKTSILVDLAISIASGTPFLGYFPVPEPAPVIVVSGESGVATLQATCERVQQSRGADPGDNLYWGTRLPSLSFPDHLETLEQEIRQTGAKLIAIDPAYLALLSGAGADSASNVFAMGAVLKGFGEIGVATGATMCLVHHARKSAGRQTYREPELDDLSQSGFAEFARQWVLLNHARRRENGVITLHMEVGGSAGHGGSYTVTADEGLPPDPLVPGSRKWDVAVTDKDGAPPPTCRDNDADLVDEIYVRLLASDKPLSRNALRREVRAGVPAVARCLEELAAAGRIEERELSHNGLPYTAYVAVNPLLL